jgi:glycosyltransferase involved in cell wall biosynthesis
MRIALFHNAPSGGAKRSIYEWAQRLSPHHEIDVFTLSTADHAYCDVRPFVRKHRVFEYSPRRSFRSPLGRLNQLQRWRDLGELRRIGRAIAHEIDRSDYDVVFANTCTFTFIPTFLQFLERPSVYFLHEPFGKRFARPIQRLYLRESTLRQAVDRFDPLIWLYRRRLETLQSQSLRRTRRLIANSRFTQEEMKQAFEVEALVCRCGVNTDDFRPSADAAKEHYVLSVGELTPRKGFDFIVKSLGRIPAEERPGLVLVCNTVNVLEKEHVENLAIEHGVQIQILTHLSMDELAIQYNKAAVCVYAPVLEPFGLVPLEAMASGTPVVGVREGGVQESIVHEQTGLLVERDPDQFAAAIQRLLSNPNLASEYGRNGRDHVLRNWTWDQSVASLEKHLLECSREN